MQGGKPYFVEICAPWDSSLCEEYEKQGGRVDRLGLHNGYDLSTRHGYQKAVAFLREHRPRNVHMALLVFLGVSFKTSINGRKRKLMIYRKNEELVEKF